MVPKVSLTLLRSLSILRLRRLGTRAPLCRVEYLELLDAVLPAFFAHGLGKAVA